jgi:phosphatidylinositol dimannoside acyltransferase
VAGQNQIPRDPMKQRLAILLARLISRFLWLFNRQVLYRIADVGGLLFYALFPTYRENVKSNMSHVLGHDASDRDVRRVARNAFRTSARNFADLTRVPHIAPESFLESVRTSPGALETLDKVSESGRGGVLVTAHYGAFDYVGQIIWLNGYSLTLLTARTVPEFIDAVISHLRGSRGARMEPATPGGLRRVLSALRRGELIGIVADRDFFQNGKEVTFFGHKTTLPPGPIRIARDAGAPVIPTFARREGDGYFMFVEEPFMVPKTDNVEDDIEKGLERLVEVFERHLSAAPEQWVMFQRVWTEAPQQAVRVFPVGSPLEGKILGPSVEERGPLTDNPGQPDTSRSRRHHSVSPSAGSFSDYPETARQDSSGSS